MALWVGLQCVILVFPDHTRLLFFIYVNVFYLHQMARAFHRKWKMSTIDSEHFAMVELSLIPRILPTWQIILYSAHEVLLGTYNKASSHSSNVACTAI